MKDRHRYNAGQLFAAYAAALAGLLAAAAIALEISSRAVVRAAGGHL